MPTPRRKAIKSARKNVKSLKKGRRKYVRKGDPTLTKGERKDVVALRELRSGTLKKAKARLKTAKKSRPNKAAKKADIKNIKGAKLTTRGGKTKGITSKRAAHIKKKVFKKAVKGKQKSAYKKGPSKVSVGGKTFRLNPKVTITKKSKKGKIKKKLTYTTKK
jgi:hypothetical protein